MPPAVRRQPSTRSRFNGSAALRPHYEFPPFIKPSSLQAENQSDSPATHNRLRVTMLCQREVLPAHLLPLASSLALLLICTAAEHLPVRLASGGFSGTSRWIHSGSRGTRHVGHSVVPSQTGTYFQRWTSTSVSGRTWAWRRLKGRKLLVGMACA